MKFFAKLVFLLLMVSPIFAAVGDSSINMDEAIKTALENAPVIKIYKEQVLSSKYNVNLSKTSYNPTIDTSVNYGMLGPSSSIKIDGKDFSLSPSKQSTAAVGVTIPIDIGGQIKKSVDINKSAYNSTKFSLEVALSDLIKNVKTSYLQCLLYEENIVTAKSALALSEEYLAKVKNEVEVGTKPKFDITRQEYDVATRKNTLVAAEGNYKQVINNFNYVLGLENSYVTPTAVNPETAIDSVNAKNNDLLGLAFNNRGEIKKLEQDIETAKYNVDYQKMANNPKLGVSANFNQYILTEGKTSSYAWNTTATVSFPLWDGGVSKEKINVAKSQYNLADLELKNTKQGIVNDVLNSQLAVNTSLEQINTAKSALKLAEESLDIAKLRYEQSLGTYLDVSSALDQLVAAKNALTNAKYSYAINMCILERAVSTQPKIEEYTNIILGVN